MQIGKLYKVIKNGHSYPQVGDIVVVTDLWSVLGSSYFTGINLRTGQTHHYCIDYVEVLCQSSK